MSFRKTSTYAMNTYDELNVLKKELNALHPLKLTSNVLEDTSYEKHINTNYKITGSKNTFFVRNSRALAYAKIDYAVYEPTETTRLLEKNQLKISFEHVDFILKTELSSLHLLENFGWTTFLQKWYRFFEKAINANFKLIFCNKDKLQITVNVCNSTEDGNIFNLLAVGLAKTLNSAEVSVEHVDLPLKNYLNVKLLPYYFYAIIVPDLKTNSYHVVINPDGLVKKQKKLGNLSFFVAVGSKNEQILTDFKYQALIATIDSQVLGMQILKTVKTLLTNTKDTVTKDTVNANE